MPDGVHAELPQNERMLTREILQTQQVTFEVTLIVKVNVKTAKIGILRQQILGGRVSGVRKKRLRIDRTTYPDQLLNEFDYPARTEPAGHGARNFIAY